MRRVSLVGVSGSGKSTFGRRLAASSGLRYVELDAICHQSDWKDLDPDEFRARVTEAAGADDWIIDGNYPVVQEIVWARADTVFWFDIGRWTVLRRVIARTIRRAITREVLWNGNREPLDNFYRWDANRNIIRWAWVNYPVYAERFAAASVDPCHSHVAFVRFGGPHAAEMWLAGQSRDRDRDRSQQD